MYGIWKVIATFCVPSLYEFVANSVPTVIVSGTLWLIYCIFGWFLLFPEKKQNKLNIVEYP